MKIKEGNLDSITNYNNVRATENITKGEYLMYSMEELTEKVHRLKELERQSEDIETAINNIKNDIKAHMEENNLLEMAGDDWAVTWKYITSNRFDQSSFKSKYPELFESFKVATSSRRFQVN